MNRLLSIVAITVVLASAIPAAAQYPPTPGNGTFRLIEGLEYANARGTSLLLDLRIPERGRIR